MKFQLGYQNHAKFKECLLAHREKISEIYFPWEGFTTGRGTVRNRSEQRCMEEDLADYSKAGIRLCLLLNGNCYGSETLSRDFFQHLGDTVDFLGSEYPVLHTVTTASPLIAKFIHNNFPDLEVRASVNMEIGTTQGAEYMLEYFDSFYLKREFNYSMDVLENMYHFCTSRGKKMFLLANSGCLNYCSGRTFHDNLVAHQHECAKMDNGFVFKNFCTQFLEKKENLSRILSLSNFIRPEDVPHYEGLCDGIKLATRTHCNPVSVAMAYFSGAWHGNVLDLTEPAHSSLLLPEILANDRIAPGYAAKRLSCGQQCEKCSYCREVFADACVKPDVQISQ